MKEVNFSPGPTQLYFTVEDHYKFALREGYGSISHRSNTFEGIYKHTTTQLRELLNISETHHILFTSSATEIWERLIQNLVENKSFHFVNGAFSEKFYKASLQLNREADKQEVLAGNGFDHIPTVDAELIGITHNETSTGVSIPTDFIYALKDTNPKALLAIDAVSSIPHIDFDYDKIDSVYFSVQKGFGMPPGLGVWIVNDACIAKSEYLLGKGHSIGTYNALPNLVKHSGAFQTPQTPNTLAIYVLGKVAEDLNRRGIATIRKETQYKAVILGNEIESHPLLSHFVKEKKFRSPTVLVANTGTHTSQINDMLLAKGIRAGEGYGQGKDQQLRFANFPSHSKEQFELLVDYLHAIR